jgi:hypothetical protein
MVIGLSKEIAAPVERRGGVGSPPEPAQSRSRRMTTLSGPAQLFRAGMLQPSVGRTKSRLAIVRAQADAFELNLRMTCPPSTFAPRAMADK